MNLDCSGVDNKDIKDFFLRGYPNSTLKVIVFAANGKLCESIGFDVFLPLYTTLWNQTKRYTSWNRPTYSRGTVRVDSARSEIG